ncbi:recombination regulator RecX [Mesosutterella sp. AGMB02718]|uniref:Regulatory protein RecX n=1 Tax=Mesosutterella faecium TaxID=2925194 RepID=A0ABT7IKX8_9BURK|nr:recombination regulator RecX [Mesosutterella sp. AGMB02718]MDL2059015.1 recombination regulator RecX [Mesosutterella sp. AGMB02718]
MRKEESGAPEDALRQTRSGKGKTPSRRGSLLAEAVAALARREYARAELRRKLRRRFPDSAEPELEAVLDRLESLGYLSDERFAEKFVRQKGGRLGAARLRMELRQRGVPAEAAEAALSQLGGTEEERAYQVWSKKFGNLPEDERERGRQIRFLLSRGFGYSIIRDVFDRARRGLD